MYAGRIVEQGATDDVIDKPLHPYTVGLLGSVPTANRRGKRLFQIEGMTPNVLAMPEGCAFGPRCTARTADCENQPEIEDVAQRSLRCFNPQGLAGQVRLQGCSGDLCLGGLLPVRTDTLDQTIALPRNGLGTFGNIDVFMDARFNIASTQSAIDGFVSVEVLGVPEAMIVSESGVFGTGGDVDTDNDGVPDSADNCTVDLMVLWLITRNLFCLLLFTLEETCLNRLLTIDLQPTVIECPKR